MDLPDSGIRVPFEDERFCDCQDDCDCTMEEWFDMSGFGWCIWTGEDTCPVKVYYFHGFLPKTDILLLKTERCKYTDIESINVSYSLFLILVHFEIKIK